jgi:hypothetical protein
MRDTNSRQRSSAADCPRSLSAGVTGDLDDLPLTTIIDAAELVTAALTAVGHWLPQLSVLGAGVVFMFLQLLVLS